MMTFAKPLAIALVAGLGLATMPAAAVNLFADVPSGTPDVVEIADGPVRGYSGGGVSTFLGIPCAAPPGRRPKLDAAGAAGAVAG